MNPTLIAPVNLALDHKRGKFMLTVGGKSYAQNVCEFLQTISFLVGQDLEEHLMNPASEYDRVRLPISAAGVVLNLELPHFIAVREAYRHQLFLLKLEDILLRKGICPASVSLD